MIKAICTEIFPWLLYKYFVHSFHLYWHFHIWYLDNSIDLDLEHWSLPRIHKPNLPEQTLQWWICVEICIFFKDCILMGGNTAMMIMCLQGDFSAKLGGLRRLDGKMHTFWLTYVQRTSLLHEQKACYKAISCMRNVLHQMEGMVVKIPKFRIWELGSLMCGGIFENWDGGNSSVPAVLNISVPK